MNAEKLEGKEFLGQVKFFSPGKKGKGGGGWIYPIIALNGGDVCKLQAYIKEVRNGNPDLFFNPSAIENKEDVPAKTEGLNTRSRVSYVPQKSFFRFRFHQDEKGLRATQLIWVPGKEAKSLLSRAQEVKSE